MTEVYTLCSESGDEYKPKEEHDGSGIPQPDVLCHV